MTPVDVAIQIGLPEGLRDEAARLYEEAFRRKLQAVIVDPADRLGVLTEAVNPGRAIAALGTQADTEKPELLGVAGFYAGGHSFTSSIGGQRLLQKLGIWKGLRAIFFFAMLERKSAPGELCMDGIMVAPHARGQGVGSLLFDALFAYARKEGYRTIRLDVVDTNPRARQLYERLGFVATGTASVPFLKKLMGFSAVTTMIKTLA